MSHKEEVSRELQKTEHSCTAQESNPANTQNIEDVIHCPRSQGDLPPNVFHGADGPFGVLCGLAGLRIAFYLHGAEHFHLTSSNLHHKDSRFLFGPRLRLQRRN